MTRRKNVVIDMHVGERPQRVPDNPELLEMRLQDMRRAGTAADYIKHERENITAVLRSLPEGTNLLKVSTEGLESMVFDGMRARGLKPNTINHRIKSLRRLYASAIRRGLIRHNPASNLTFAIRAEGPIPSFTREHLSLLLRQPNAETFTGLRDYTAMLMMLDTGLRVSELLSLNVEQVDIGNRVVRGVSGKNKRITDVPLSSPMQQQLRIYMAERGTEGPSPALFVTVDGNRVTRRNIQQRIHNYGVQAGITDVRVSPHTFRHTLAKQWLLSGADAISLKELLRHSTMDQVSRYVYFWSTEIQEIHDKHSPLVTIHSLRTERR